MGRLEDIAARNQKANRNVRERTAVSLLFGCIILLIIGLMVFTDLGKPPVPPRPTSSTNNPPGSSNASTDSSKVTGPDPHDKHVDGVLLRKAPSHPAPPSNPTAGSAAR